MSQRAELVREMLGSAQSVLLGRVDTLSAAALHLLTTGPLDEDARGEARRTAHQLVSLGVFGVPRGAELARRAEALLAEVPGSPAEVGAALAELSEGVRHELLMALAAPLPAPQPAPQPAADTAGTVYDVLVVDDDPVLVELLQRALEGAGWRVRTAGNGPAALAELDVPPGQRPSLVLLDIDLPALDGFDVLRALAGRGLLRDVQVLCLTARSSEPDVVSLLSLGAVDHVAKPFSLPVLLARVSRALGSR